MVEVNISEWIPIGWLEMSCRVDFTRWLIDELSFEGDEDYTNPQPFF